MGFTFEVANTQTQRREGGLYALCSMHYEPHKCKGYLRDSPAHSKIGPIVSAKSLKEKEKEEKTLLSNYFFSPRF